MDHPFFPKLLASVAAHARDLDLNMQVVGSAEIQRVLASFEETKGIRCFDSIQEARTAGA